MMQAEDDDMSDDDGDSDDDDGSSEDEDEDGEADEIIEFIEGDDMEGDGAEWLDEDDVEEEIEIENGEDAVIEGDFLQVDDGQDGAPVLDDDDIDDGDSEDPDSYTDEEEMYLAGELEFDPEVDEQTGDGGAAEAGQDPFRWDLMGGNPAGDATTRRSRLLSEFISTRFCERRESFR